MAPTRYDPHSYNWFRKILPLSKDENVLKISIHIKLLLEKRRNGNKKWIIDKEYSLSMIKNKNIDEEYW